MLRTAVALAACVTLFGAVGCNRGPNPVRSVAEPEPGPAAHPRPRDPSKPQFDKPMISGVLACGLVGMAASPLTLACYADFAQDTADLLDLTPRYDKPVMAGLLGAGLSGTAAAGPWQQLAYADVAAGSFDLLRGSAPPARPANIVTRSRRTSALAATQHPMYTPPPPVRYPVRHVSVKDLDLRPLANPGAPGGGQPKGGAKGGAKRGPKGGKPH